MIAQLPQALIESLQTAQGFDEKAFKDIHASGEQVTSVRFNPAKKIDVKAYFPEALPIPWSSTGHYLPGRPSFTTDPLFHAGTYYVQEAASMFLEEALKQSCDLHKNMRVLDLCAAPGGKSTLIQSLISKESLLVANEVIKTRVNILADNITKWGAANVIVTNNDAKDFRRLREFFDVIILDAPCSGSGLFRKDPAAIDEWSLNNVALCSARQQRIVEDVLPALKKTGILIYSTCSYSESENEVIAEFLAEQCDMENIPLTLPTGANIVESISSRRECFGYRFYPDKVKAEGLYLSVFRKKSADGLLPAPKKNKIILADRGEINVVVPHVKESGSFSFIRQDENIIAFPKALTEDLESMKSNLYIKKAGVKLGTVIRGTLIPDHELAVSTIRSGSLPLINVDHATALDYLRRKDIVIADHKKGWALIGYMGNALGLIKILPGRINNYYPASLRILNK